MTAELLLAAASSTAPPGYFGPVGALLAELAAVLGALTVVLGVLWRVAAPHVRAFVDEQSAAARQLQPDHGSTARDAIDRTAGRLDDVDRQLVELRAVVESHGARLHEHLQHAAVELSMLRAVCAAAGVELVPRPTSAPRRRWYDDDDPAVTSWEVRPRGRSQSAS